LRRRAARQARHADRTRWNDCLRCAGAVSRTRPFAPDDHAPGERADSARNGPQRWTPFSVECVHRASQRSTRAERRMDHLTIVTTGGTIDKIYFDDKSQFQIGAPQIGEILEALGVAFTFEVLPVL